MGGRRRNLKRCVISREAEATRVLHFLTVFGSRTEQRLCLNSPKSHAPFAFMRFWLNRIRRELQSHQGVSFYDVLPDHTPYLQLYEKVLLCDGDAETCVQHRGQQQRVFSKFFDDSFTVLI